MEINFLTEEVNIVHMFFVEGVCVCVFVCVSITYLSMYPRKFGISITKGKLTQ